MKNARIGLFAVFLVLLQGFFAERLALAGVPPQLPLVFVVFWALWAAPRHAFLFGWFMGLGLDLVGTGPLGFHAALLGGTALAIGQLGRWLNRDASAVRFLLIFASCLALRTLVLLLFSVEGVRWGSTEWVRFSLVSSAYTAVLGTVLCHLCSHLPFFRSIRPPARLSHA